MYVFDTNVLINYLNGVKEAKDIIHNTRFPIISVVTRLEVLAGFKDQHNIEITTDFLGYYQAIDTTKQIADLGARFRHEFRLKTPDAIIAATALYLDKILISRDKQLLKLGNWVKSY